MVQCSQRVVSKSKPLIDAAFPLLTSRWSHLDFRVSAKSLGHVRSKSQIVPRCSKYSLSLPIQPQPSLSLPVPPSARPSGSQLACRESSRRSTPSYGSLLIHSMGLSSIMIGYDWLHSRILMNIACYYTTLQTRQFFWTACTFNPPRLIKGGDASSKSCFATLDRTDTTKYTIVRIILDLQMRYSVMTPQLLRTRLL